MIGNTVTEPPLTQEELEHISECNALIEQQLARDNLTRAIYNNYLSMSVITQENGYYCGPATACMDTRRFQRVTISTAALETSVRSSLRNDFPLTLNVKEMPNYTSGSGHFIAVKGYYFNTSTDFKTITICDPHPTYSGTYTYTLEEMETAVESSNGYYNRLDASTV